MDVISPREGIKSADGSVQAVLRMWDENLLILKVDKKICGKLKKGDIVLADYTPISDTSPYRRMVVIKIIPKEQGESILSEFRSEHEKRKQGEVKRAPMPYIR